MPISSTNENPWEMIKYKPVLQSHTGAMMNDSEYKNQYSTHVTWEQYM